MDGVLVLPDFHKLVKKKVLELLAQVFTIRLSRACSLSDCVSFLQAT